MPQFAEGLELFAPLFLGVASIPFFRATVYLSNGSTVMIRPIVT
jgi:hypothetical protein